MDYTAKMACMLLSSTCEEQQIGGAHSSRRQLFEEYTPPRDVAMVQDSLPHTCQTCPCDFRLGYAL